MRAVKKKANCILAVHRRNLKPTSMWNETNWEDVTILEYGRIDGQHVLFLQHGCCFINPILFMQRNKVACQQLEENRTSALAHNKTKMEQRNYMWEQNKQNSKLAAWWQWITVGRPPAIYRASMILMPHGIR